MYCCQKMTGTMKLFCKWYGKLEDEKIQYHFDRTKWNLVINQLRTKRAISSSIFSFIWTSICYLGWYLFYLHGIHSFLLSRWMMSMNLWMDAFPLWKGWKKPMLRNTWKLLSRCSKRFPMDTCPIEASN